MNTEQTSKNIFTYLEEKLHFLNIYSRVPHYRVLDVKAGTDWRNLSKCLKQEGLS